MKVTSDNTLEQLKLKQKEIRNNYLNEINKTLYKAKLKNNSRLLYSIVHNIIINSIGNFLWITCNIINYSFK